MLITNYGFPNKGQVRKMEELQHRRDQMKVFRQDYLDLKALLADFPKKPAQPAFVPFGNVAFLKGEFRETNEITVSLGAEYYAQYTAKDAVEVVDRRLKFVEVILREIEMDLATVVPTQIQRSHGLEFDDGEGTAVDIREEWTSEDESFFLSKVGEVHDTQAYEKRDQNCVTPMQNNLPLNKTVQTKKTEASGPVKSKIVERVPRKPSSAVDPSQIILGKQVKESLFKRRLREAYEGTEGQEEETFAP